MTKTRSTKRALLMSGLALLMCVSMLIGSTFAWFTDSVTSAGNKIQAGTLKIDLELLDKTSGVWNSIKEDKTALFDYDLWEPGYTDVKILKVENEGSLALKWMAKFVSDEELSILADVIDVYVKPSATALEYPADRDLSGYTKVGTLRDFVNTIEDTTYGSLKAEEEAYLGIALKMQESAGNDYQGKSLGAFDIQIVATQLTYENDSFNNQYDKDAKYPGEADVWDGTVDTAWYNDTDTTFALSTAEELAGFAELVNDGNKFSKKTIELESNIDFNGEEWTPIKNFAGTLKGNGYAVSNFEIDATAGNAGFFDVLEWATVENLMLTDITATVGNYRFGVLSRSINQTNIDNVTVKNVNVTTTGSEAFVAGLFAQGTVNSNMEVNNCTVENLTVNAENGAMIIAGITDFVQKNGTEAEGTNVLENLNVKNFKVIANDTDGYCNIGGLVGQTQSVWQNPRFNNCSVSGLDVTATGTVNVGGFMCAPGSYTYAENCTVEGKIDVSGVTSANNYAGGFFGDYGWGDNVGKGDHKVTACSANVDIATKYASAGGFVGSGTNSEGRNKNITLTNCKAEGTVSLVEGGTANVGGFAGQTDRGIYINCSATQDPFIGKVMDGYTLVDDGNGTLTVSK